eukprot:g58816.t1
MNSASITHGLEIQCRHILYMQAQKHKANIKIQKIWTASKDLWSSLTGFGQDLLFWLVHNMPYWLHNLEHHKSTNTCVRCSRPCVSQAGILLCPECDVSMEWKSAQRSHAPRAHIITCPGV